MIARVLALLAAFTCTALHAGSSETAQTKIGRIFQDSGLVGTMVVSDEPSGRIFLHNPERARTPFLPASTFKIPNTLIALETKVVDGPDFTLNPSQAGANTQHWWPTSWNQEHSLRTALRNSVVWYYQELARRIGPNRMGQYLARFDYGNGNRSAGIDRFWLEGSFGISAEKQVEFLKRLYYGKLGLSERTTRIARDLLILESTEEYRLSGKTGWLNFDDPKKPQLGWFVGYVERADRVTFFAMNIDMKGGEDAKARLAITKAVLRELGDLQ